MIQVKFPNREVRSKILPETKVKTAPVIIKDRIGSKSRGQNRLWERRTEVDGVFAWGRCGPEGWNVQGDKNGRLLRRSADDQRLKIKGGNGKDTVQPRDPRWDWRVSWFWNRKKEEKKGVSSRSSGRTNLCWLLLLGWLVSTKMSLNSLTTVMMLRHKDWLRVSFCTSTNETRFP